MLEKFWPLTVVVGPPAQKPPMASTPAPASSSGSSKLIRPAPALTVVQNTSVAPPALRVPAFARIRLAVAGSVQAAVAVDISVSMLPLVSGCGRSVLRYQLTVVALSAWRQREPPPRSVNGSS